jgi:SMI1-KNR4 cell-wall
MWIEYIKNISDDFEFTQPATEQALVKAESTLGLIIPEGLHELLMESNGVEQRSTFLLFILSIERIVKDNFQMRYPQVQSHYMPFDNLLFFADAGNGDKFGFPISQDGKIRKEIFAWNHENDNRTWCAPSLKTFIQWWHAGKIKY